MELCLTTAAPVSLSLSCTAIIKVLVKTNKQVSGFHLKQLTQNFWVKNLHFKQALQFILWHIQVSNPLLQK